MMHDRKFWDRKLGRSPPFFPPVAAGPAKFRSTQYGALLEVPSTGSIGSAIAAITRYSNTIYDGPGWESLGDNATLVTPSNPRIQLMRLHAACYVSNSTIFTGLRKYDGVSAYGRFNGDTLSRGESGGDTQTYLLSAILPAVAGERFQHWLETAVATSQQVQTDKNWFGVEVLAPGTRYTFLQKNTNQALSTAGTPLIWDVENVDTLGLWTSGANLVVPAGTTGKLRVTAGAKSLAAVAGACAIAVYINGVPQVTYEYGDGTSTTKYLTIASRIFDVVPGDIITIPSWSTVASWNAEGSGRTWVCVEEIPANHKYCIAQKSAAQAISAGVSTAVLWDGTDIWDPLGLHDPVTNSDRINIPNGVKEYRATLHTANNSSAGDWLSWAQDDLGSARGQFTAECQTGGQDLLAGMGMWMPTQGLSHIRCFVHNPTAASGVNGGYFQVEFR